MTRHCTGKIFTEWLCTDLMDIVAPQYCGRAHQVCTCIHKNRVACRASACSINLTANVVQIPSASSIHQGGERLHHRCQSQQRGQTAHGEAAGHEA